jgi:arsenite methyltransferase
MKDQDLKEVIQERYGQIARGETQFCCPACGPTVTDQCLAVGYCAEDLQFVPELAVLGVGCGNPTALADLKVGEPGMDAGPAGKVLSVQARGVKPL